MQINTDYSKYIKVILSFYIGIEKIIDIFQINIKNNWEV